jgi:hypothetical protein
VRGDRPGDRAADHLDELRKYLSDEGMTEWYLPTRLEYVERLPRNGNGTAKCARSYSGTGGKPLRQRRVGEGHADVIGPRRTGQSAPDGWRERLRCGRLP